MAATKPLLSFFIFTTFLFFSNPAFAYLDPGTGSLLIQGLIALVGGIIAAFAHYRRALRLFFSRLFGRKSAAEAEDTDKP
jgi:hypothetical protein